MADIYCGYRILLNENDLYEEAKYLVSHGFEYGIKFKIDMEKVKDFLLEQLNGKNRK